MENEWQWLGYGGTTLVVVAYLPQVRHLARKQCSAGLSAWAYSMWAASALLLLVYAIRLGDSVFIALQSYQLFAALLICFYCRKYRHSPCKTPPAERNVD